MGNTLNIFQKKLSARRDGYRHLTGSAADLLTRPHGALLQGLGRLELALSAVQGPQVPQSGVHCGAGHTQRNTTSTQRLLGTK